ncbi:MAG: gamma-glutamyltransferase [Rhodospirillales bacterium]|nr:gamma-glutamyltransferase [Rhodospirillales bacterium]
MANGMVCAPQPEAVEAGAMVLKAGGNAIDAAIATALVQTAVDPFMSGIAGFGELHVVMPKAGVHQCLQFHARAPGAVTPDMWQDKLIAECEDGFGFILEGRINEIGYQSIATPQSLRAYDTALKKWGTMSLGELIQPAIGYLENGWMIRPHVRRFWEQEEPGGRVGHLEYLRGSPATAKIYLNADGSMKPMGGIIKNPDMAKTYRRIAEAGADDFYEGELAAKIVADMEANGGLISAEDLKTTMPQDADVLWTDYRGYQVASSPPPGGGIMVLQMLNILENFDLKAMGHNSPEYIRTVAEAMKISTVDKDNHVGDPRFVDVPVEHLLSKDYAKELADRIKSGVKTHVPRLQKGEDQKETTQLCTVDNQGNCVSMTHSLGMPSGVTTEGLGFVYNGCMGVFDPRPGRTGSLAPGKSRFSSMAPTVVFKNGKPMLLIGAPGGTYIAMGVLQGILNVLDFNMDAQQAVSAPRFSATSDIIEIVNRIPRFVQAELEADGYKFRRYALNFHFAGVHAIRITENGLDGGADPGRDGMAMAV